MTETSDKKAVLARIHGRVQGVGYRNWTVKTARLLGLCGWVRNRADGTVEAHFEGTSQDINEMLAACQKGPSLAKVEKIDITQASCSNGQGFKEEATI